MEYYLEAIKLFHEYQTIVCTDDIESVKKEMNFSKAIYSPFNNNELEDLYLLTQCDASIICNSSFSWWGAYLGKNKKIVVAPKSWFASDGHKDFHDIYCKDWIII